MNDGVMNVRGKSGFFCEKFLFNVHAAISEQGIVKGERDCIVACDVRCVAKIFFSIMHKPSTVCCDFS